MAYISRIAILRKLVKENPDCIIFTERSVHTDKKVFAQMLHDQCKIEQIDFIIYKGPLKLKNNSWSFVLLLLRMFRV